MPAPPDSHKFVAHPTVFLPAEAELIASIERQKL